jgi:hypothetical protein
MKNLLLLLLLILSATALGEEVVQQPGESYEDYSKRYRASLKQVQEVNQKEADTRIATESLDEIAPGYYTVAYSTAVRNIPSASGDLLNTLSAGTKVKVLLVKDNWAQLWPYYKGEIDPEMTSNTVPRWIPARNLEPWNSKEAPTSVSTSGVNDEIIQRCKESMIEYGPSIIKACVDQDIEAYTALSKYSSDYDEIVSRCTARMQKYGYSIVKACADQDIEAQQALDAY